MSNTIDNSIFKTLLTKVECVTGDDLDVIGFEASYRSYSISFQNDNGVLVVEECVKEVKTSGKTSYELLYVSETQKQSLTNIIDTTKKNIEKQKIHQDYNDQLELDHQNWLYSSCGSSTF